MRAFEVRKPFQRLLTAQDIIYNGLNVSLYRVIGYNEKFVALSDGYGRCLDGVMELVINEKHKVPLYKQAMNMQMGKVPKTMTQSRKILRLQQISPETGMRFKYDYYVARI